MFGLMWWYVGGEREERIGRGERRLGTVRWRVGRGRVEAEGRERRET
jgi:hypothetical protein